MWLVSCSDQVWLPTSTTPNVLKRPQKLWTHLPPAVLERLGWHHTKLVHSSPFPRFLKAADVKQWLYHTHNKVSGDLSQEWAMKSSMDEPRTSEWEMTSLLLFWCPSWSHRCVPEPVWRATLSHCNFNSCILINVASPQRGYALQVVAGISHP